MKDNTSVLALMLDNENAKRRMHDLSGEVLPVLLVFMYLPLPIRAYVYSTNALERVNKQIKRRLKNMEQFQNETLAEKYLYAILSEMINGPLKND